MTKWTLTAAILCVAQASEGGQTLRGDWPRDDPSARTQQTSAARPRAATDPVADGIGKGAVLGAAATLPLVVAGISSCGAGCVRGSALAIAGGFALVGAGIGSAVGLAADLDTAPSAGGESTATIPSSAFFPTRPGFRIRPLYGRTGFTGTALARTSPAQGVAVSAQLSPHLSFQGEYLYVNHAFYPSAGAVPDDVTRNVVDAQVRLAGHSRGIERRYVSYVLSELVGFHPRPWGRLRVALLAGAAVRTGEKRDYYDAHQPVGSGRTFALPGKYYVLNFESPEFGLVLGVDAEFALSPRIGIVPSIRHYRWDDPGGQFSFAIGGQWRF